MHCSFASLTIVYKTEKQLSQPSYRIIKRVKLGKLSKDVENYKTEKLRITYNVIYIYIYIYIKHMDINTSLSFKLNCQDFSFSHKNEEI